MRIASLALFVAVMWGMILSVAAFLVYFVAPIDSHLFGNEGSPAAVSIAQAAIAFALVIGLVSGLTRMKKIYLQKKLRE